MTTQNPAAGATFAAKTRVSARRVICERRDGRGVRQSTDASIVDFAMLKPPLAPNGEPFSVNPPATFRRPSGLQCYLERSCSYK
jgi:hypothetical protein